MKGGKGLVSLLGWALLLLGLIGVVFSVFLGSARMVLVLLLPVIIMEGPLPVISVLMVSGGLVMVLLSGTRFLKPARTEPEEGETDKGEVPSFSAGGVVFIGPVPIVFGSSSFRKSLPGPFWLWSLGWLVFVVVLGLFVTGALMGLFG
ncbi:MAG: hypothetical protein DRN57_03915 [Thermoplasmata archaeon]|nr:MAG: hypothetical protein DRN57_03915 [Thermoplasmata archaeon]